jgi:hypothetical protein
MNKFKNKKFTKKMNRLSTQNLILTSLLVSLIILSNWSFAGRNTRRPIPTPIMNITPTPTVSPVTRPPISVPNPTMTGIKKSTYYWGKSDPTTINSYIDGASTNGIGIIYLDLEPYAYNIPLSQAIKELATIVQYAKSKNVLIHGLIGAPTFAQPTERQYVLKVMEVIKQFNNSQDIPIVGIHLNIEFYNIPAFQADSGASVKNSLLINYLDFHKTIVQLTKDLQTKVPSFELSSTLPHFTDFEASYNPIPFLAYDNTRVSIFEHIARILDSANNSSIVIMSYRSTAKGPDSISGLIKNEFALITKFKTKIVIAVETNDIQSSLISLYGKTKSEINSILTQSSDVYKSSPNFGGIAIHDIKAYLQAK